MEHAELRDHKPFLEHLLELRRRFFYVSLALLVGAGVGFAVNEPLQYILVAPLGQQLYYTSPLGGFEFIFRISLFVGFLTAIPVFVYNLLKFIEPTIGQKQTGSIFRIVLCSFLLLAAGVSFGYFVSLPTVLRFLTGFTSDAISALISTAEYLPFVTLYLLAFGMIFQIPLIFFIINRIRPINPQKLKNSQKYVIVGSFIMAAIISPTPDILNQSIMALPIIVLYELSLGMILLKNRHLNSAPALATAHTAPGGAAADAASGFISVEASPPAATPSMAPLLDSIRPALSEPTPRPGLEAPPLQDSSPPVAIEADEHVIDLREPDDELAPAPWMESAPLAAAPQVLDLSSASNHVPAVDAQADEEPEAPVGEDAIFATLDLVDEQLQPHRLDTAS